ncbi:hypothetical protein [Herbaspirillum sp.]|uniref:hypothetical protein n=1 Tax=Herbaspirillum sp. TaxID=1890675 RepID=UPI0031D4371E
MIEEKSLIYSLEGPYSLSLEEKDLDLASIPDGHIFAKTLYSAISTGTELAAWSGKPPLRPSKVYPRLMGYCNVAQIQSVGREAGDFRKGDIILTHQSHRTNFICRGQDVLLRFDRLEDEDKKKLATSYLFHLGYSALSEGQYRPGAEVAIVGFGALGYCTASLVSAYGGFPQIYSGRSSTLNSSSIPHAAMHSKNAVWSREASPSKLDGADIVINTSDAWEDYELSLQLVRRGGTIVLLGFPGRGQSAPEFNPLDSRYIYDKLISIKQAGHVINSDIAPLDVRFNMRRNLAHIFALLRAVRINASPLLSAKYPWSSLAEAYTMLHAKNNESLSAILDWTC